MASTKHPLLAPDPWQRYVDLVKHHTDRDDSESLLVPLFPCDDFVPGNVERMSARAARALAGMGTREEVRRVRSCLLKARAKARH